MDIQDQPLQAGETQAPIQTQAPGANIAHTPTTPGESTTNSTASPDMATHGSPIPIEEHQTASRSHKGLIIGVILAAIAVVSGLSLFIGFNNSASQYQGFLQKIETETEKLNADKTSVEQGVPAAPAVGVGDASGANSRSENDANSKAALPELGEDTLPPVDLAPTSPATEDEGLTR